MEKLTYGEHDHGSPGVEVMNFQKVGDGGYAIDHRVQNSMSMDTLRERIQGFKQESNQHTKEEWKEAGMPKIDLDDNGPQR